jgi:hypothetical protein
MCAEFAPLPMAKLSTIMAFTQCEEVNVFNCVLYCMPQVAEFTDPDWGIKSTPAWGCRTSPPGYMGYWTYRYCKVVEVRLQNVKVTNYGVMAINANND